MFRDKDAKLERLAQVDLFRKCDKRQIQAIGGIADEVDMQAGDILFREGESGRFLYVIESGEVAVSIQGEEVAVVGAGEAVGEMALLDRETRTATCTAKTDLEAYVISAQYFEPLLEDNPSVAIAILEDLVARMRDLEEDRTRLARMF